MKKTVLAACFFMGMVIHGAEQNNILSLSFIQNKTVFQIIKANMYEHNKSIDFMFVDRNQQQKLKKPSMSDCREVGRIYEIGNTVRVLPKELDSSSDDDTYKPYETHDTGLWKKAEDKTLSCNVLSIIAPRIGYNGCYEYFPRRAHPTKQNCFIDKEFFENDAIGQASIDLEQCYCNALTYGLAGDKCNQTIAFTNLGTAVGFPRDIAVAVAFKAIVDFIARNPNQYAMVKLFVEKRSEFDLYKQLASEYLK